MLIHEPAAIPCYDCGKKFNRIDNLRLEWFEIFVSSQIWPKYRSEIIHYTYTYICSRHLLTHKACPICHEKIKSKALLRLVIVHSEFSNDWDPTWTNHAIAGNIILPNIMDWNANSVASASTTKILFGLQIVHSLLQQPYASSQKEPHWTHMWNMPIRIFKSEVSKVCLWSDLFYFRAHQAAKRCLKLYAGANDSAESALDSPGQTQYSADEDMQDEIEIMIETDWPDDFHVFLPLIYDQFAHFITSSTD